MSEELLRRTEHEGQSQSRSADVDPSTAEARKRQPFYNVDVVPTLTRSRPAYAQCVRKAHPMLAVPFLFVKVPYLCTATERHSTAHWPVFRIVGRLYAFTSGWQ